MCVVVQGVVFEVGCVCGVVEVVVCGCVSRRVGGVCGSVGCVFAVG